MNLNNLRHNWGNDYRCSLPEEVTIQLKTSDNRNLELDFVLCSLYITVVDHEDCYAYHYIPSDANGRIRLTREELIYNTELQFWHSDHLPLDDSLVAFHIMITRPESIQYFNRSAYGSPGKTEGAGNPALLDWHSARQRFFELRHASECAIVEKSRNLSLRYDSEQSLITGYWKDREKYAYDLMVQP